MERSNLLKMFLGFFVLSFVISISLIIDAKKEKDIKQSIVSEYPAAENIEIKIGTGVGFGFRMIQFENQDSTCNFIYPNMKDIQCN